MVDDLAANHGRRVTLSLVQDPSLAVAGAAFAKEESWHYATPKLDKPVASISVGLDGNSRALCAAEDGNRQVMVGTISPYDREGERQHTIYLAATPEYGKATFYQRLSREIAHVVRLYPRARLTGVADGSADNWTYLGQYTKDQCIDFHHATSYSQPGSASDGSVVLPREEWLNRAAAMNSSTRKGRRQRSWRRCRPYQRRG